eukprot:TRINITY_DN859_c0_g2_i2.p1 TRINITY_DN859_c0_g2~~TRINITY_DN859_c0_g2_i2.p1  ORF type:complete len:537 (-),score=255.89 TRINITY_DN859_c0_g2_i2:22-1632(-)
MRPRSSSASSSADAANPMLPLSQPATAASLARVAAAALPSAPSRPLSAARRIVLPLFQRFDALGHVMTCLVLAWLAGVGGFSFVCVLLLAAFLYHYDSHRTQRIKRTLEHQIRTAIKEEQKRIALAANGDELEPWAPRGEPAAWFNAFFDELWPNLANWVSQASMEKLKTLLETALNSKKPPAIESLTISEMHLGNLAPSFDNVIGYKPRSADYRLEFDLSWTARAGKAGMSGSAKPPQIVIDLGLGSKLMSVRLKEALLIQDFAVNGRMRFDCTFVPRFPYVHSLAISFVNKPEIDFAVKPLKAFDIMDIPLLKNLVSESFASVLHNVMLLPKSVVVPFHLMFPGKGGVPHAPGASGQQPTTNAAVVVNEPPPSVLTDDPHQRVSAIQRSKKEGDLAGLLHVRLFQVRALDLDRVSANGTPYCLLAVGSQVCASAAVKRSKQPVWDEFFEMIVSRSAERTLELTVLCRDDAGDTVLGRALADFSQQQPSEPRDLWLPVTPVLKKNEQTLTKKDEMQVHVNLRFVPERSNNKKPDS